MLAFWYTLPPQERTEILLEMAWDHHATHYRHMRGLDYLVCHSCGVTYYPRYALGGLKVVTAPAHPFNNYLASHPRNEGVDFGIPKDYRIFTSYSNRSGVAGSYCAEWEWRAYFGENAQHVFLSETIPASELREWPDDDWLRRRIRLKFLADLRNMSKRVRRAELGWATDLDAHTQASEWLEPLPARTV